MSEEVSLEDKKELTESNVDDTIECKAVPEKPPDMKCNIFGLDHDIMMEKVIALKKKVKGPQIKSALISPDSLKDDDLFEKIPGIRFEADSSSRNDILKKFQIQRKMLMKKKQIDSSDTNLHYGEETEEDDGEFEVYDEDDFIDDETEPNSHRWKLLNWDIFLEKLKM